MVLNKKTAVIKKGCVACGCCVKTCPMKAIIIHNGIFAVVSYDTCVGCGKCKKICPAGVIEIERVN